MTLITTMIDNGTCYFTMIWASNLTHYQKFHKIHLKSQTIQNKINIKLQKSSKKETFKKL